MGFSDAEYQYEPTIDDHLEDFLIAIDARNYHQKKIDDEVSQGGQDLDHFLARDYTGRDKAIKEMKEHFIAAVKLAAKIGE